MADDSKLRSPRPDAYRAEAGAAERSDPRSPKDPLAELARLIGQDDLFEQMRKDAARAGAVPAAAARHAEPAPRAQAPDIVPDLRSSFEPDPPVEEPARRTAPYRTVARHPAPEPAADEHYEDIYQPAPYQQAAHHQTSSRQPAAHPQAPPEPAYAYPTHDDRHYADPQAADPAYADAAYDPAYPYDDQAYTEEPPPPERRRGGMMMIAAVLGLAVVGTAGAFAYRAMSGPGGSEPPVIQASGTPNKVTPSPQAREQAGRSLFDRGNSAQPERVVSREEQPVELREARGTPARTLGSGSPAITGTVGTGGPAQGALPASALGQGIAAPAGEPKKVKTIPIRPDGAPAQAAQNPGRTPPAARNAPAAGAPVVASAPPTRTASVQPTAAAPAAASGHVVQVASQKSEEDAQASFRALQAKYPTVLGGRQPLIRRIDLGERGVFYRVQVGPFASADQANDLCGNLKSAGGQCIVQRN